LILYGRRERTLTTAAAETAAVPAMEAETVRTRPNVQETVAVPATAAERALTRTTVQETVVVAATAAERALTRTTVALTAEAPEIGAATIAGLVPIHGWPVTRCGGGL